MAIGTVKWISEDKEIGIVFQDDGREYIFLYQSDLNSIPILPIKVGQKVSYNLAQGVRGMVASEIKIIKKIPSG